VDNAHGDVTPPLAQNPDDEREQNKSDDAPELRPDLLSFEDQMQYLYDYLERTVTKDAIQRFRRRAYSKKGYSKINAIDYFVFRFFEK